MIEIEKSYEATKPNKRTASNGNPYSFFTVEEIAKNRGEASKHYWKIMCFQEIDINEGDMVRIDKIVSINAAPYNGRMFYTVVAEVSLQGTETLEEPYEEFVEEDPVDLDSDLPPF